jgi:hypothetical protein
MPPNTVLQKLFEEANKIYWENIYTFNMLKYKKEHTNEY